MKNKIIRISLMLFALIFSFTSKINIVEAIEHYSVKINEKEDFGNISECYYLLPHSNIWNKNKKNQVYFTKDSGRSWMAYRFFRYDFGVRTFDGTVYKNEENALLTMPLLINNENYALNFDNALYKYNESKEGKDYSRVGCPKYLKFVSTSVSKGKEVIYYDDVIPSNNDNEYQDFIDNYYYTDWSNVVTTGNTFFKIDSSYVPTGIANVGYYGYNTKNLYILPLYSYWDKTNSNSTEKEGSWIHTGERCYLADNLDNTQNNCNIKYTGKDPAEIYIKENAQGYNEVFNKSVDYFVSMCANNYENFDFNILKNIINNTTKKKDNPNINDDCWGALTQFKDLYYSHNEYVNNMQNDSSKYKKSYYDDYYEKKRKSSSEKTGKFVSDETLLTTQVSFDAVEEEIIRYAAFDSLMSNDVENFKKMINANREIQINQNRIIRESKDLIENPCESEKATLDDEQRKECQKVYEEVCYPRLENSLKSTNVTDVRNSFINSFHDCMKENYAGYEENVQNKIQEALDEYESQLEQYQRDFNVRASQALAATPMPIFDIKTELYEPTCDDIIALRIIWIILRIAAPVLTVALGIFDFAKAIVAGDDSKISKAKQSFTKRLIALILFILIPFIISSVLNLVDEERIKNIDLAKCIVNGS